MWPSGRHRLDRSPTLQTAARSVFLGDLHSARKTARPVSIPPKATLDLFFRESVGTLQDVAAESKYLGAELAFLGVLQTWSHQLWFHLHIHYIVPGGGLRPDGLRWMRPKDPDYFLPERVLAARFKPRLRQALQASPELLA